MTWAEARALFGLDDVALKGLLSVKQSGSNAIKRMAVIGAHLPLIGRSTNAKSCPLAAIKGATEQREVGLIPGIPD